MRGSIWRPHIDWGDLLPRRLDSPVRAMPGTIFISLPFSLSSQTIQSNLSVWRPFLPFSHSFNRIIPLLHTTHLSSQGHLASFEPSLSPSLSARPSSLEIFSPVSNHLVSGPVGPDQILQRQRCCRYCAAMLCNSGSIANRTEEGAMHVLCGELKSFGFGVFPFFIGVCVCVCVMQVTWWYGATEGVEFVYANVIYIH